MSNVFQFLLDEFLVMLIFVHIILPIFYGLRYICTDKPDNKKRYLYMGLIFLIGGIFSFLILMFLNGVYNITILKRVIKVLIYEKNKK